LSKKEDTTLAKFEKNKSANGDI